MEYFLIYLIGTVDGLKEVFNFVGNMGSLFCLVIFFVSKICSVNAEYEAEETLESRARKSFKAFVFCLSLFIFTQLIPNSKTLIAMVTIPPVINNEQVQELPENVLGFINDYIKEKRDELQGVSGSSGKV